MTRHPRIPCTALALTALLVPALAPCLGQEPGPEELRARVREVLLDAGPAQAPIMEALRELGRDKAKLAFPLLLQMPRRGFLKAPGTPDGFVPDHRSVSREILLDTVNLSLIARVGYPWAQDLSRRDFETFVASHRHGSERLTNWRRLFRERADLMEAASRFAEEYRNAKDPAEKSAVFRRLVHHVNSVWLASKAKYAPRGMPDLAPEELLEKGTGRCTDLTCAFVCACRAYGIAATNVRAIWWPKGDSNHCWAAVLDPATGEWYDVDAGLPGEPTDAYFRGFKGKRDFAKVYRIVPGLERGPVALSAQPREGETADPHVEMYLLRVPMEDVTAQYGPVAKAEVAGYPPGSLAYVCVYNQGEWRPVAAARADAEGKASFPDLGANDVLYLPAFAGPGGRVRSGVELPPFLARANGRLRTFPGPRDGEEPVAASFSDPVVKGWPGARLLRWGGTNWTPCGDPAVEGESVPLRLSPGAIYVLRNRPAIPGPASTRPFSLGPGGRIVKY
ncbi:MAG: transglutaminase-like domain-containing protein [Planctomycetes bacterium]|jgi:hypothetical protein|nr:transglutaminase-like domain-containing protein [Planctomycetota bacterium]